MAEWASLSSIGTFVVRATLSDLLPKRNVGSPFHGGVATDDVGVAQKTRSVDARPVRPGEVAVTIVAGEGIEITSKPARSGDMVVRNGSPETVHEQYLLAAGNFAACYEGPLGTKDGATSGGSIMQSRPT